MRAAPSLLSSSHRCSRLAPNACARSLHPCSKRRRVEGATRSGAGRRAVRSPPVASAAGALSAAAAPQPDGQQPVQADSIIEPDGAVSYPTPVAAAAVAPPTQEERHALLRAAVKAPMYSVGLAPILVSAAAAYIESGAVDLGRTALFCVAAVCIIAWLNLSNDVFDSATGVDKTKPESVVNLLGGNRKAVFLAATAFLATGVLLLFSRLPPGPPFRWSYLGLGEPLCFLAFGPLATNAFYLAQSPAGQALTPMALALSVLVGLTTTVILFCAHFHQLHGDLAHGKMSPVVRLGMARSTQVLKFAVGLVYVATAALSLLGVLPFTVLTSVVVVYGLAAEVVKMAEAHPESTPALRQLKMLATRWHIGFSAMLVLGLLLQALMV
eukprot:scaffold4.g4726.t1